MKYGSEEKNNLSLPLRPDSNFDIPNIMPSFSTEYKTFVLSKLAECILKRIPQENIIREINDSAKFHRYDQIPPNSELTHMLNELYKNSILIKNHSISTEKLETKKDRDSVKVLTLNELFSRTDDEIPWLVQNIFPAHGTAIISGAPGAGKTWLLLSLALQITLGGNWLGHFPVKRGTVLYCNAENPDVLIKTRCRALINGFGLAHSQIEGLYFAYARGTNLFNKDSTIGFSNKIKEILPDVIIFDSLIRFHNADENSSTQMAQVFNNLLETLDDHQCSCIFADHLRKPSQYEHSGYSKLRGSTEKSAFVDSHLSVSKKEELIKIEHSKSRCAIELHSFGVRITNDQFGSTSLNYSGNVTTSIRSKKIELTSSFLNEILKPDSWLSRQEILESGGAKKIPLAAINRLLIKWSEEGKISKKEEKQNQGRGKPSYLFKLATNENGPNAQE